MMDIIPSLILNSGIVSNEIDDFIIIFICYLFIIIYSLIYLFVYICNYDF